MASPPRLGSSRVSLAIRDKAVLGIATMLPILQRHLRKLEMRFRYRRHNDNVHLGILDHVLRGPVALDPRMVLFRIVVWLRRALDDSIQLEVGDDFNEGDVEYFGGHATADDADVVGLGRHILRAGEEWGRRQDQPKSRQRRTESSSTIGTIGLAMDLTILRSVISRQGMTEYGE